MPDVTVVIPTRDRWDVLSRTLGAIRDQELGGIEAELIVVDNGSRTPPPELPGARLVAERLPGAAAARNRGVAEARGRIVLFVGDDCIPSGRDFVRGHAGAHPEEATRAVTGRIEWDPEVERTEVMDWLERDGHIVDMERLRREPPRPETFYTGNVSVPRQALLEVGGFDQRFSGYGFEDLELALRLADRGVRFEHRPDLGVRHSHRYGMERSLARMEAVGRGARLLHTIHDHRRPLPGPPAGRRRIATGLALARVPALRTEPPRRAPRAVRDLWLRASHLGAFARGYAGPPVDDHPWRRGYGAVPRWTEEPRPAVSVVVPFLGSRAEGEALLRALARLELGPDDEVILADNGGALEAGGGTGPRVVRALRERSSYYARNAGADAATNDWLLFLDSDTLPPPSLLDDYFREPVEQRCGIVAGGVAAARGQRALVARYAASRRYLSQAAHIRDAHRPYGITANLLVRRSAWAEVGGFFEGLRSGGDQDLCWRAQDAGWALAYREPAAVEHRHRERVVPLLRQMARYSAAIAWMARRAPGSSPRPAVTRRLARSVGGALAWRGHGRRERAVFKALDGAVVLAEGAGYLASNDAPRRPVPAPAGAGAAIGVVVDEFPTAASAELARAAGAALVAVEARRRPDRPDREAARDLQVRFAEDDGIVRRLAALLAVLPRHLALAWLPKRRAPGGVKSKASTIWTVVTAARRFRRAGAGELWCDPESRARAALIAAVLGVPPPDAGETSAKAPEPALRR
jgi:GT2 family glycosyltransferase